MRNITRILLTAFGLAAASCHPGWAAGYNGTYHYGPPPHGYYRPPIYYSAPPFYAAHPFYAPRFGVYYGPGPYWPQVFYPPVYYPPTAVYAAPPSVYVEPPSTTYVQPQQQAANYWYYCPDPSGYYPYVQACPKGWMQVVPQTSPQSTRP